MAEAKRENIKSYKATNRNSVASGKKYIQKGGSKAKAGARPERSHSHLVNWPLNVFVRWYQTAASKQTTVRSRLKKCKQIPSNYPLKLGMARVPLK
jgi:hypothetical protein